MTLNDPCFLNADKLCQNASVIEKQIAHYSLFYPEETLYADSVHSLNTFKAANVSMVLLISQQPLNLRINPYQTLMHVCIFFYAIKFCAS